MQTGRSLRTCLSRQCIDAEAKDTVDRRSHHPSSVAQCRFLGAKRSDSQMGEKRVGDDFQRSARCIHQAGNSQESVESIAPLEDMELEKRKAHEEASSSNTRKGHERTNI